MGKEREHELLGWELELAALEANKAYCIARALVFAHDNNHALRHSYLAMVDNLDEEMGQIRSHVAALGPRP